MGIRIIAGAIELCCSALVLRNVAEDLAWFVPIKSEPSENKPPRKHDRNVKQRMVNRAPKHNGYY